MKIKVTKDLCEIKENEIWNVGDYNVHTVQVELSPEFNGLVNKVRYFVEDNSYDMLITDNVAQVPYEATVMEGTIKIGVYGYDADTDILVQSTSPVNKYIASGTYTGEADNTEPLTPTDKQQMETAIQKNADDIIDLQNNKQDALISGENIKTINNESILGGGNINIEGGGGGGSEEDNITITKNSQNKIQTVAIIDSNTGSADKTWIGTKQQYDAIQTKDSNTLYYITDDGAISVSWGDIDGTLSNQTDLSNALNNKVDTSKVKNVYSTTNGDVYDVIYINSTIGDIESLLSEV